MGRSGGGGGGASPGKSLLVLLEILVQTPIKKQLDPSGPIVISRGRSVGLALCEKRTLLTELSGSAHIDICLIESHIINYSFSAPICVTGAQHVTQRVVVVIGGIIGGIGICLSCFLFNIQYVIVTFGALYGRINDICTNRLRYFIFLQ